MNENKRKQISMEEALKYQDALSKKLRGNPETIDLITLYMTEIKIADIDLETGPRTLDDIYTNWI